MEKMYSIGYVNQKIRKIQEKYREEIKPNEEKYGEENTKKDLIIPILQILNWDTESKTEVDAEFCIKNIRSSGSADYALKIDGEIKLLIEAKAVDKVLETGYDIINGQKRTYVEQLVGYAFDLNRHMKTKIDYCILTNGKEWRIYYMGWKGVTFDKKLVYSLKLEEFIQKFPRFWDLEKNNVNKGSLSKYVFEDDRIRIDKKAVNDLLYCKKLLVDSMIKSYNKNERDMKYIVDKLINKPVSNAPETFPKFYEIQDEKERFSKFVLEASSNVINKILFIRIIEDKGFVKPKLTKQFVKEWKETWSTDRLQNIMKLFRDACEQAEDLYNGGLFRLNPYDELPYNNNIIEKIMGILGDFNFEEIDADVIGRIYEIYLGTVLSPEKEIRGKKRTKLSAGYTERKKLGQYYTPKFVVDFIVKNTLGKLLEGKTPKEVSKIKVLDPACGSGSFLIRAFDYLKDYYVRYNDQQMSKVKRKGIGNMNNYIENGTIIDYNHKILKENLHGVDLNDLSVQICSINLWLRALEKDKKLEKLSKNILHGNSLISGVESKEELAKYKNELKEIAKLREEIKNYYGRELSRKERDLLEGMEDELLRVRLEINSEINENLKEYFKNLDLIYPFNWEVEFTEVFDNPEEKQGFDVVIGNPPYVRQEKLNEVKHFFLDYYKGYNAVADLYVPFIEKSIILLRKKGMMSFIIPNKWLRAGYGRTLRKFILDNCKILNIIDFDGIKVFEDSTVDSSIIILQKEGNKKGNKIKVCEIKEKLGSEKEILNYIENNSFDFNQDELSENEWSFFKTEINEIRKRIFNESKTLKEYVKDKFNLYPPAYRGVTTGSNETYVISEEIKNKLVNKQNKHLFVPVIRGENLRRWSINYKNEYLLLITEDTDINKHPEVKKYLETKKDLLKKRWEVKKNKIKWYELRPCSYYDLLARKDKIIYCDISETNPFNYDKRGYYIVNTAYAIPVDDPYLLGLLNSRLMLFAFTSFAQKLGGKGYRFIYEFIERLPIHYPNKQEEAKLKNKVIILVNLTENKDEIINKFTQSLNNQTISDEKACKFEHYWNYSDLYDFSKETMNKINVVAAKILNMEIMEEDEKLILTITNYNEKQKKTYKNVQALRMNIKNKTLKKFLYFNIKKYINEKKGRGFGSGIILESIKKIQIPVYIVTCKRNLEKIKKVMDEFNHETKDLWKIDSKKYKSLSEIEDDIEKTDREIDEMVYDLYGITGEEKKIIEDSLK